MKRLKAGTAPQTLFLVPRQCGLSHELVPRLINENQRLTAFVPLSQTLVTWDTGQDQGASPPEERYGAEGASEVGSSRTSA
jgi:hypothetical protein